MEILKDIAEIVKPFVLPEDIFIDFSCGSNAFAPLLSCKTISYDISPAPNAIAQDWFSVSSLPEDSIIGLNPPFGYQGQVFIMPV